MVKVDLRRRYSPTITRTIAAKTLLFNQVKNMAAKETPQNIVIISIGTNKGFGLPANL